MMLPGCRVGRAQYVMLVSARDREGGSSTFVSLAATGFAVLGAIHWTGDFLCLISFLLFYIDFFSSILHQALFLPAAGQLLISLAIDTAQLSWTNLETVI